jgi:pyruvate/2-oxoglutarate/acetoin dehydrogenase E1 component
MLYNRSGVLPAGAGPVDLRSAIVRRPGKDVTFLTYGRTLFKTLDAGEAMARRGGEAELGDLRVLRHSMRRPCRLRCARPVAR